uniref:glycosyltransferase n=1 Tax=Agathobacter sp. TaxID=2021311 RepID=UPI0040579258
MGKRPILSISVLASNRRDTIRRCLDSLIPVMEQIPSELILADTSTDPQIRPILEKYTDKVISFTWCNDFSKARNAGLALAKGEWFLYIDDDEWFVEIEELVDFFQSGEYKKYGCANYIQRNFHDPDLVHYSDSWVSRIIKMQKDTHFESKIHEYLVPVPGECKNIRAIANHTGYICVTEEDLKKRFERNSVLLMEMIAEEPKRLRWRVQLAQEYNAVKMWDKLWEFCEENLEYTRDRNEELDNRDIGTFYAGAMESLISLGNYEKAKEIGQKALHDKRVNELCQAYVYLRLAVIAFRTQEWRLAVKCIEAYFIIRRELEKKPNRLANQQGALLVNEAFDDIPTKRAYSILIGSGLKQKNTKPLRQYFPLLEWNKKVIYVFMDLVPVLIEAMATLPYEPIFTEAMQLMWNNKELQNTVFPAVHAWEERDKAGYNRLLQIMLDIAGEHWYIWYGKVLAIDENIRQLLLDARIAEEEKNKKLAEWMQLLQNAFLGFLDRTKNVFLTPPNITQIAKKYKMPLEEMYLSVPYEKWQKHLHDFIAKVEKNDLVLTEKEFAAMKTKENIRYEYLFVRIAEANVLYSTREQAFAKKREALLTYAIRSMDFFRKYYKESVLEQHMELLPAFGQAAVLMERAFCLEEQNPKEMLSLLRQTVDYYPTFAEAIKSFIQAYGFEQSDKKRRQKEEFNKLKSQILAEVHKCVANKQYEQALAIVGQLKQMEPENLELIALSLEIRLAML